MRRTSATTASMISSVGSKVPALLNGVCHKGQQTKSLNPADESHTRTGHLRFNDGRDDGEGLFRAKRGLWEMSMAN
jgi:hypothetical protein